MRPPPPKEKREKKVTLYNVHNWHEISSKQCVWSQLQKPPKYIFAKSEMQMMKCSVMVNIFTEYLECDFLCVPPLNA